MQWVCDYWPTVYEDEARSEYVQGTEADLIAHWVQGSGGKLESKLPIHVAAMSPKNWTKSYSQGSRWVGWYHW